MRQIKKNYSNSFYCGRSLCCALTNKVDASCLQHNVAINKNKQYVYPKSALSLSIRGTCGAIVLNRQHRKTDNNIRKDERVEVNWP